MCLRTVSVLFAAFAMAVHGITFDEYEVVMRLPSAVHSGDSEDLFGYTAALHNMQDPNSAGMDFNQIASSARYAIEVCLIVVTIRVSAACGCVRVCVAVSEKG